MAKIKKCNFVNCIVKAGFKNFKIGEVINIKQGYANYLLSKSLIVKVYKKSNTENVLNKKILTEINPEIEKLLTVESLSIERKVKKKDNVLFQKITTDQIMHLICKNYKIKYFNCFYLVIKHFDENNQFIEKCGNYNCEIYFNEKKISNVKVIVIKQ